MAASVLNQTSLVKVAGLEVLTGEPKADRVLWPPNGLELSCPAEAGRHPLIVAHAGGKTTPPYGPARRVSFSELLGCGKIAS